MKSSELEWDSEPFPETDLTDCMIQRCPKSKLTSASISRISIKNLPAYDSESQEPVCDSEPCSGNGIPLIATPSRVCEESHIV